MAAERLAEESPRRALWLAAAGVACIVGGEMLCILGPLRYERVVHIACHTIFYAGIVMVVLGAVLHWGRRSAPDSRG